MVDRLRHLSRQCERAGSVFLARHPAAERHRRAAHRAHARAHRDRRHHPLASHARRQHALAARHRPRRHRHPDGGGAQARRRGPRPPRPRPRRVRKARLGVEGAVRRHHQAPDDPPRRLLRLDAASASRSTPASPAPCARSSSASTKRASSTAASTWSTGARAATPRSRDLEVVHEETQGNLWHIRYPGERQPDRYLVVATTRPETMLGDTAVAINAEGRALHATCTARPCMLPLMDREIPDHPRRSGRPEVRHRRREGHAGARPQRLRGRQAPQPAARSRSSTRTRSMTAAAGPYAGLDRFEARKRVVADLEAARRCSSKIEPYTLSARQVPALQDRRRAAGLDAVVRQDEAARRAGHRRRRRRPHRSSFRRTGPRPTYEWMYNIRDWCISRQLWWGHRIPAWHCGDVQARSSWRAKTPAACPQLRLGNARAGHRRARHLVQLRALAVLHAGLAGPDRRT